LTRPARTLLFVFFAVILGTALISFGGSCGNLLGPRSAESLRYDEFVGYLSAKRVRSLVWQQNELTGKLDDGGTFSVVVPDKDSLAGSQLLTQIQVSGARFEYGRTPARVFVMSILSVIAFPVMILTVIYFLLIKPAQRPSGTPIALFSGSADKETDAFTIPIGRRADIGWSAISANRAVQPFGGSFSATLMSTADRSIVQVLAMVAGDGTGTTRCYCQGEFYIQVTADVGWTILVHLK